MTNPFENVEDSFYALVNDEGQYSLWPGSIDVPAGWIVACGPEARDNALEHIERSWQDMRPLSLRRLMDEAES